MPLAYIQHIPHVRIHTVTKTKDGVSKATGTMGDSCPTPSEDMVRWNFPYGSSDVDLNKPHIMPILA